MADDPTPAEIDAFMAAIQEPELAERANYEGAMADLHTLVEVARAAAYATIDGPVRPSVAVAELRRFLDANHPKEADRG